MGEFARGRGDGVPGRGSAYKGEEVGESTCFEEMAGSWTLRRGGGGQMGGVL